MSEPRQRVANGHGNAVPQLLAAHIVSAATGIQLVQNGLAAAA